MSIYVIDPLADDRWNGLVERHPLSSAFHQRTWLNALARTYGYRPCVLTSTPEGRPLADGIVFCRISSWITGTRLVSLPFSDHCEPLLSEPGNLVGFSKWLRSECDEKRWKYIELRPLFETQNAEGDLCESASYCFHELDIRPSLQSLFEGLHKNCVQRSIRRAERECLSYEVGHSQTIADEFYQLLLITRRRHKLLPQPRAWFQNLIECMGNRVQIRVARKNGTAVAAILTLRHASSVVYKYGCSNDQFHNLGAMPFLFWRLVEESKAAGVVKIDLGRSDAENRGLIAFKDRLGGKKKRLTYYRYPKTKHREASVNWHSGGLGKLFSVLPDIVSSTAGRIVYRHVG